MDADLRLLLQAWLNDDVDHDALEPAVQRLEQDAEFRRQLMDELSLIGLTRVAQAETPEWERLTFALEESDLEQRVMAALDGSAASSRRPALSPSSSTTREPKLNSVPPRGFIRCGLLCHISRTTTRGRSRSQSRFSAATSDSKVKPGIERFTVHALFPWPSFRLRPRLKARVSSG